MLESTETFGAVINAKIKIQGVEMVIGDDTADLEVRNTEVRNAIGIDMSTLNQPTLRG